MNINIIGILLLLPLIVVTAIACYLDPLVLIVVSGAISLFMAFLGGFLLMGEK